MFVPVLIRFAFSPYLAVPEPRVHDEFSYLLGSDTFTSGRLANPVHPLWVFFETIHVNLQPAYAMKYPPAQSFFLAVGQYFLNQPWYGVLLSVSFMTASIYWMLRAWLPPPYPFIGALWASLQFGVVTYWGNSYWGGCVAAAGGALAAGAVPRLARKPSAAAALAGAAGVVVLANSRPYEGLVFTAGCCGVLLFLRWRARRPLHRLLAPRVVVPAGLVLCGAFAWMGYYNYRLTGTPWELAYAINQQTYAANPQFLFLPERPAPVYRHQSLEIFWRTYYLKAYRDFRERPVLVLFEFQKGMWFFFPAPQLFLMVLGVILAPTFKLRAALAVTMAVLCALLVEVTIFAHYLAPATCLLLLLTLEGTRCLIQVARRYPRIGDPVVLAVAGVVVFQLGALAVDLRVPPAPQDLRYRRHVVLDTLSEIGGEHLVIVRYKPDHDYQHEWVYNRADIDASDIVWARDMGEEENRKLLAYYPERKVWLLQPDEELPLLTPYD